MSPSLPDLRPLGQNLRIIKKTTPIANPSLNPIAKGKSEISKGRVVAEAVVGSRESLAAKADLTVEQQLAKDIFFPTTESDWRQGLERGRNLPKVKRELDKAVKVKTDTFTGGERDPQTNKLVDKDAREAEKRKNDFQSEAKVVSSYLSTDYNTFKSTPQAEELRTRVEMALRERGGDMVATLNAATTPAEKAALIDQILSDKEFRTQVEAKFKSILEADNLNLLKPLKEQMQTAEKSMTEADVRLAQLKTDIESADQKLAKYEDRSGQINENGKFGKKGKDFDELEEFEDWKKDELDAQLGDIRVDLKRAEDDRKWVNAEKARGVTEYRGKDIDSFMPTDDEINMLRTNRTDVLKQLAKGKSLQNIRTIAKNEVQILKNEEIKLNETKKTSEKTLKNLQEELKTAKQQQLENEILLLENMEELVYETAHERVDGRMKKVDQVEEKVNTAESEWKDKVKQAMRTAFKQRYHNYHKVHNRIGKGYHIEEKLDKVTMQEDLRDMIFNESATDTPRGIINALKTNAAFVDAEVQKHIDSDGFAKEMSAEFTESLLLDIEKQNIKGKEGVSPELRGQLLETPWGRKWLEKRAQDVEVQKMLKNKEVVDEPADSEVFVQDIQSRVASKDKDSLQFWQGIMGLGLGAAGIGAGFVTESAKEES